MVDLQLRALKGEGNARTLINEPRSQGGQDGLPFVRASVVQSPLLAPGRHTEYRTPVEITLLALTKRRPPLSPLLVFPSSFLPSNESLYIVSINIRQQ
jgi:hypothetical protein